MNYKILNNVLDVTEGIFTGLYLWAITFMRLILSITAIYVLNTYNEVGLPKEENVFLSILLLFYVIQPLFSFLWKVVRKGVNKKEALQKKGN